MDLIEEEFVRLVGHCLRFEKKKKRNSSYFAWNTGLQQIQEKYNLSDTQLANYIQPYIMYSFVQDAR